MNTPIKFRAWDKKNKKWLKVYAILFDDFGDFLGIYTKSDFSGFRSKAEIELLQFTGLTDKNGKDVYEGDIIKHPQYPTPLRVEWDYDQWGLFDGICNEASLDKDCEIVGNIYEN